MKPRPLIKGLSFFRPIGGKLELELELIRRQEMKPRPLIKGLSFFLPIGGKLELELELIQTQMAQKPMLRAEVGMRVRCANKASAE